MRGRVSGSGDIPTEVPFASGALSITPTWVADANASGYVVFGSTSSQTYPDPALYSVRYLVSGGSTEQLVISGIASGVKYVRIAAHNGTWVGDLGPEVDYTPA
jgi:hypothetical protein